MILVAGGRESCAEFVITQGCKAIIDFAPFDYISEALLRLDFIAVTASRAQVCKSVNGYASGQCCVLG